MSLSEKKIIREIAADIEEISVIMESKRGKKVLRLHEPRGDIKLKFQGVFLKVDSSEGAYGIRA